MLGGCAVRGESEPLRLTRAECLDTQADSQTWARANVADSGHDTARLVAFHREMLFAE